MKKLSPKLLAGLTAGWMATANIAVAQSAMAPVAPPPAELGAVAQAPDQTNAVVVPEPAIPAAVPANSAQTAGAADQGLVPNLRGVSVDAALKYLTTAAGFVIMRETDTKAATGTVDLVSETPVSKEELVGIFNKVLAKNDLTAIQDGRTLTIMTLEAAKLSDQTPVMVYQGTPDSIPRDAKVVTEVITLHSLNPTEVVKDLFTLRPPDAEMNANPGGNAIIMTAKQSDIRRFAQIIAALDNSGNGDLEVFLLSFADSKAIAQELKDVFSPTDAGAGAQGNPFVAMFGRSRGGGGGGGGGGNNPDDPKRAAIHVNAVSDDQNNAVLVSAPIDIMPGISNLITKLDIPQEDTIQIKVFGLKHADPTDIANELAFIFPDPTYMAQQQQNGAGRRGAAQFQGGGGGGGGRGGVFATGASGANAAGANSGASARLMKQTTVYAVPDARTQSIIVTASKDTMVQIEHMITQLDENAARMMHVFVFRPVNADVTDMQGPLQDLFQSTSSRSSTTTTSALTTRATQAAQTSTISSSSSSSFGTAGGGGGR
jgi:type II secretory pathway component GspD/PulD (secretin)